MLVHLDKWWKSKAHRRIKGARGARFASLKFHVLFLGSVICFVEWVMRSTDCYEDPSYHIAPPPVAPPPPLAASIGYALSREMPHLRVMELEKGIPSHLPKTRGVDYVLLRSEGRFV
ncbi:uncharacterized protein TEOVI_000573100 [Trypanosoma equiperdum]|uniref:Developmentally regulated protein n=4 Tax=Trypanozoon TaxID=39700 RepID=Q38EX9_TRYB2|nr:hypothetical protein, conserved [Trypanosoma brucei gambiense DAL972]XP_826971.1 hypothetical protein, conserved [Trypanosoma brucei brucei TREU927]RHW70020.1 hypothetical protein DPX39_090026900 [Trypanosoma brucei equiperdum]SCU68349.1 hypothetical protein, conserved [Trypanosoma equiperdum]EAN76641.1 hypothetical protein, conserved [Trypanosoma brucei brucei TREU927]RHW70287.1 hypothetical protein DPX39_090026500 [Trypanosoma brucei equiperdum]RHW70631.1 hypothetical protein DPX39_09002|eukprot:XP_011776501.1 hypothetical protein, conserved [Trypanosoma brucei gambiense DAL972]